jgi:epoxyqueuosine reductase QueG
MCVPIAADAGLGELGRLGLLITPEYGPRVRLSIVTTNMPLAEDPSVTLGVQEFCSICRKCAIHCPSGSVDGGEKAVRGGVEKWQTARDACYRFWRQRGSDCAICVRVCPYSNPSSPVHSMVRWAIRRNPLARRLALWGDDLLYGARRKPPRPLPDWHAARTPKRRMGEWANGRNGQA